MEPEVEGHTRHISDTFLTHFRHISDTCQTHFRAHSSDDFGPSPDFTAAAVALAASTPGVLLPLRVRWIVPLAVGERPAICPAGGPADTREFAFEVRSHANLSFTTIFLAW
eukprot:s352_g23.t1